MMLKQTPAQKIARRSPNNPTNTRSYW